MWCPIDIKIHLIVITFVSLVTDVDSVCVDNVACFPSPQDVVKNSRTVFNVNSTCGSPAEQFCSPTSCGLVCNASDPANQHSKEQMIDAYASLTYWKSKNLQDPVFIQVDLNQKLILHQIEVTFQFDYPSYIYIERSQDFGRTYQVIHHSAINCLSSAGLLPLSSYQPSAPVCMTIATTSTSKALSYMPRTDSSIAAQIQSAGPVRDYFLITNLRYVLSKYQTPASFDKRTADPTKYFFAIRDFDLQASCFCNGMSDKCNNVSLDKCICQKNTQGDNCQECKPLYNNKAWQYGIACEACNCSSLAAGCVFDASKGHGICQNCTRNTTGDFCHQCRPGFHRNAERLCVDCGCDLRGVNVSGKICNETTATCLCKQNVEGRLCSTCKDQFWGISSSNVNGCNECACRTQVTINGTNICRKDTGQCPCQTGFTGRTCNECRLGYYSNVSTNPTRCNECLCNPSGSLNISCSSTGYCYCRPRYSGQKCETLESGYYSASVSQLLFSSLRAVVSSSAAFYSSSSRFLNSRGDTVYHVGYSLGLDMRTRTNTQLFFNFDLPSTSGYEFFIRYSSAFTFNNVMLTISRRFTFQAYACVKDGATETITSGGNIVLVSTLPSNNQSQSFGTVCLSGGQYTVTLNIPYNSSVSNARILVTSLQLLPSYRYSSLYLAANSSTKSRIQYYYSQSSSLSTWSVSQSEGSFYTGYGFGAVFSSAIACQCNSVGSVTVSTCNQYGGQCSCKANVTGIQCDSCLPNHANFSSGRGCSACGCHPFGSTNTSCNPQTGACQCRSNVVGPKCDQCRPNYYGVNTGLGCFACNCSATYAASQQCLDNGTCICKQGIGGEQCSQCLPGYYNLSPSGCTRCSCNPVGSLNSVCNVSTSSCSCKENAMGVSCDQCKAGFYGYSNQFPSVCLNCYCSGKTQQCRTASGFYYTTLNTSLLTTENNVNLDGWTAVDGNGFSAGTMIWDWNPAYSFERGFAKLTDSTGDREIFFSAPSKYLGDKRTSFMLKLTFDLAVENTSLPINSSSGDVILRGNNASYTLNYKLPSNPTQNFKTYEVSFDERFWRKNQNNGPIATKMEFLAVISNLRSLYIRGKWTNLSGKYTALANVKMQYSTNTIVTANVSYNVENCSCPAQYTGLSCERCNTGFTRSIPYGSANASCVACQCNSHSSTCNPDNGICEQCRHFTTGRNCESCLPGYYGNATRGTSSDCLPCPCPGGLGTSNQFSRVCTLADDGQPNCTACQIGYTGRRCEMCQDGYSGNPTVPNGRCTRCVCSNNIEPRASGNCNNVTGECLKCLYNTTGFSCEICKNGTFGNALSTNPSKCQDCSCNATGSQHNNCNRQTGQCECKPNILGRTCNQCVPNSFNFSSGSGCSLCNCNRDGSNSQQCYDNGTCSCKPRVIGEKCDQCIPGFYNLAAGCLPCNCSSNYTVENTTCDVNAGQCLCKRTPLGGSYGGRQCDQCGPNAIGTPPDCALCEEPCYDNWNRYIAQETATLANLMTNTSALLRRFGDMSYNQISTQIQVINNNLTYAATVFDGGQYDTRAKEAQFRQIETSIISFETSVNRSDLQLQTLEQFFRAAATFNGTVNLDSTTPSSFPSPFNNLRVTRQVRNVPSTASPSSISTMAQGYLSATNANNVSGYLNYSTILQNYNQIQSANQSINQAATDIATAMTRLSQAAVERARAATYLNTSFQITYQANSAELQAINTLVQSIKTLLNTTATMRNEATSLLATAQSTMTSAESLVNSSRTQANAASQAASEMQISSSLLQTNAQETQSSAIRLKANADALAFDIQQTNAGVTSSINKVATIRNQTQQVINTASKATNQTLPVTLARIQSLSSQITATTIDETQINQTLAGAENGLQRAQAVQATSQRALNSSQSTLTNIQAVEASLRSAEALRNSTRQIQATNDQKVTEIKNITSFVENQFRSLHGTGQQTLQLVNSTIKQVNESLMCFSNAQATVENATLIAQSAQNISTNALLVHQSNTQSITSYSTQINTAHATTTSHYAEIQAVQTNATQLLSDVTEAERLLAQFIDQNAELTRLQKESVSLETELDALIGKYEQAVARFSTCNRT